jgi:hypothetical protein
LEFQDFEISRHDILRATPSAAGPHSREEGCVVVAMLR